ncbi:LuxR family transcriptional regulator [Pelagibacterium sp.]|uniref:LuxR family transcriptional regulator n=1 Tax=Pelagibacterium sp. TaxID=1967288 RepID=UPI003BAD96A8
MQHVFEIFLEQLAESVDDIDLTRTMSSAAAALNLPIFAYLSLMPSAETGARVISNYPSRWTSHYLQSRYDRIDPVILRARCQECPFQWGKEHCGEDMSATQQQFLDEAAEFGIVSGLTIPIHDRRGNFAALTFAADEGDPASLRVVERYDQALQLMATCFHTVARAKTAGPIIDGVKLTPREHQCLQWAACGKSARDIGTILGIKRRTASFHLDNAKAKLGVRTRAQAVARLCASRSLIR